MKLPVQNLETKNYTIGQKVLMVKHFGGGIELKKQGTVIAITDKTLIVKSDEEMIFTDNTMSVQGEYVLFPSVEAYQNYVHKYNKFEMKKKELMNEIGGLTDGLTFEDIENLIVTVKMIKQFGLAETMVEQPMEEEKDVLEDMNHFFKSILNQENLNKETHQMEGLCPQDLIGKIGEVIHNGNLKFATLSDLVGFPFEVKIIKE